ncbi:hypothetical protein Droror1_Dr00006607 [Drosera rotundifolia]
MGRIRGSWVTLDGEKEGRTGDRRWQRRRPGGGETTEAVGRSWRDPDGGATGLAAAVGWEAGAAVGAGERKRRKERGEKGRDAGGARWSAATRESGGERRKWRWGWAAATGWLSTADDGGG